jgi:hypothetical protein
VAWCDPDLIFLRQLAEYHGELHSEDSLLRLGYVLQGRLRLLGEEE